MSPLLEEFTLRELVISILGEAGRRILNNRTKTNQLKKARRVLT
jgi:hypothetical protein